MIEASGRSDFSQCWPLVVFWMTQWKIHRWGLCFWPNSLENLGERRARFVFVPWLQSASLTKSKKNGHPQSERQTQRSHNRTCCPPLLLGGGGPAQPAEIAFVIGGVAQHIDALQQPAPHHAATLVTERLKAPATVVVAHPTCAWERWKKIWFHLYSKKKIRVIITWKECSQPYQLLRRVIQAGTCERSHHWNRSLHCWSSQER